MRNLAPLAFAALASSQQPHFADIRKTSFPLVDTLTFEIFPADLDRDGRIDLVPGAMSYAAYPAARPLVYWNRGGGRMEGSQTPGFFDLSPLGVGDLDQDGDLDLVIASGAYRNDGGDVFTEVRTAWSVLGYTENDRFAVGDVNGDGRVDVCSGHQQGRLWLSQGGLAFRDATDLVPGEMLGTPVFADFDGDGDLDLLTFRPRSIAPAMLARNDGTGRFAVVPATLFPTPARDVRDVAIADFDGDRTLDLVLVGRQTSVLLINRGASGFVDESWRTGYAGPALAVAAGDVDGDRDVDLVFGSTVYINRGSGSFDLATGAWQPTRGPIQDLVLVDLDQDGDLDLVEARTEDVDHPYGHGMANHVAWNDGRGRFRAGVVPPIPLATQAGGAALGDLDGDGNLDLLVGEGGVQLLRGDGRGGFGSPVSRQLAVRGRPLLGDLDGDGDLDAILVDAAAFTVLVNPGNATLQPTQSIFYRAGIRATDGVLGDFDGDGALDLLVATVGPGQLPYVYGPAPDLLYRGGSQGGFPLLPVDLPGSTVAFDVDAGDVDGDGLLDAIVPGVAYLNTGIGFQAVPYAMFGFGPLSRLALADMDGDGDLDIVSGNGCDASHYYFPSCNRFTDSPRETIVWNESGSAFTSQELPTSLSNTRATAVGDIDEDGDADMVFGNIDYPNTPGDQLVLNDGNRTFRNTWSQPYLFPYDTGDTRDLFLADLDFDGDLDLVALDDPPGESGYPASRVYVNLQRHLRAPDLARLGLPYRLWLEGATQGAALFLATGPGRASTPYGRFGLDLASTVVAGVFGPPSQGRRIATEPTVPLDPSLLDATLWWQGAVLDRNALRLTNVVADRIGQ